MAVSSQTSLNVLETVTEQIKAAVCAAQETNEQKSDKARKLPENINQPQFKSGSRSSADKSESFAITKQTSNLSNGDLLIHTQGHFDNDYLSKILKGHMSSALLAPVVECTIPNANTLAINLDRTVLFRTCVTQAKHEGFQYGYQGTGNGGIILINTVLPPCNDDLQHKLSLCNLRAVLLSMHMQRLLEANGYSVQETNENVRNKAQTFFNFSSKDIGQTLNPFSVIQAELLSSAIASPFNTFQQALLGKGDNEDIDLTAPIITVDGRYFIEKQQLCVGGKEYSKSLGLIKLRSGNEISSTFQQVVLLERLRCSFGKKLAGVIHITNQRAQFHQQQVDILWRILGQTESPQVHVVHGQVMSKQCAEQQSPDVDLFFKLRKEQMITASVSKYGECVRGDDWTETIQTLTNAVIKFEILSNSFGVNVLLDVSERGSPVYSKGGCFVLYNYARLCTLFANFEKSVVSGVYPPLPPAEESDYSLLKEEEEWKLLFNYILPFPSLVKNCIRHFSLQSPQAHVQTHRACQFLTSLSRDFSVYYSRIHVLGEPREHLLALMFARLHLLQAIKQVLLNTLRLLDIEPPLQM